MSSEGRLSELVRAQMKLEKEIQKKLHLLKQRVDSVAARLLIHEMQLDTKKHAEILEEVLKAMREPRSLWDYTIHVDADKQTVRRELEEHVAAEEKMMKQIEEETKRADDEALKLLLEAFADDEKKHHKHLKTILNKTYKIDF